MFSLTYRRFIFGTFAVCKSIFGRQKGGPCPSPLLFAWFTKAHSKTLVMLRGRWGNAQVSGLDCEFWGGYMSQSTTDPQSLRSRHLILRNKSCFWATYLRYIASFWKRGMKGERKNTRENREVQFNFPPEREIVFRICSLLFTNFSQAGLSWISLSAITTLVKSWWFHWTLKITFRQMSESTIFRGVTRSRATEQGNNLVGL